MWMMSKTITQTVIFKASPHEIYETLMDSARHTGFSGAAAEISREVGGRILAYDGYITGKNIELVPDRKIVQSWRAVDWDEEYYSTVTFELTPVVEGTLLEFTHANVPDGTEEEFSRGWIDNYWDPIKRFLEK